MGATLPVLADYFARLEGRRLAPQWLHTVNLAGAALGVAVGGFAVRAPWSGAPLNADDNMRVEFRGPKDAVRRGVESVRATMAALESYITPVETVLVDPSALLGSRERLQGLIEGLRARGLTTRLLRGAPGQARLEGPATLRAPPARR